MLTSSPVIYLKTSLPSDSRESAVKLSSRRAAQRAAGTSVPLAFCCQHRQCVAATRPVRTACLEVSLCCVLPHSQRTERKRHSENRLVFVGGLIVGCADLASAPSGGAGNKSCAGRNAAHSGELLGCFVLPQLSVRGQCWMLETRDTTS